MKPSRGVVVVAALVAVVAFPGTSAGDTFRVKATGDSPATYEWDPSFRHMNKGDRVRWRNPTDVTHRVVAYKGRWSKESTIAPGETTAKRFKRTGSFKYRCTITGHSTLSADGSSCTGMCGEVHVTR